MRCLEQSKPFSGCWRQNPGCRGCGCRGEERVFNGDRVSIWEEEEDLEIEGGDGRTTM